jgi:hypothetical protein
MAGCAGSSVGNSLQQSLEADPQLEGQGTLFGDTGLAEEETGSESESGSREDSDGETQRIDRDEAILPPGERSRPSMAQRSAAAESSATSNQDTTSNQEGTTAAAEPSFSRSALANVPEDLKPYVEDLLALRLFSRAEALKQGESSAAVTFAPNQTITRGQYANWLLAANNLIYSDQPGNKIRPALESATPIFQDVPSSHPYFRAIQGLAEAGLIPSPLTGNSTAVNFRPDAPLTRESLILWKVPLDLRTGLPTATVDAVQATWGFQDAAEIEPLALRAVLADHQAGDFANIQRAFGYTTLFQPQKAVTQAEAAATLWRFGPQTDGVSAKEILERPQSTTDSNG